MVPEIRIAFRAVHECMDVLANELEDPQNKEGIQVRGHQFQQVTSGKTCVHQSAEQEKEKKLFVLPSESN